MVNALTGNDFQKIESIIKENINKMAAHDRRLVMNFTIVYSYGENTIRVLELLKKYNISPNSYDLYTAINRNQPAAVIQFIIGGGAQANGEILLLAMEKQRFDLAKQFIEAGIGVNYQYPLTKMYADGMTPLLYASKWNNIELVRLLVERGANINARAKDGNTALSIASANGNIQIYNYLMEHGAGQMGNNIIQPQQSTGISSILDNQAVDFQRGVYRRMGGNTNLIFSGNANSGNISYTINGKPGSGFYKIDGGSITIMMEGHTFIYKLDSGASFSGNGEVWVRTGN
jgi:ankyrin repeat protein